MNASSFSSILTYLSKEGIRIRGATFPLSTRGSITNGKPVRGLPNELYTNWAVASIVSNFTKGEEARIVTERSGIALKTDSQLLHGCADRHGNSAPFRNGWGGVTRQRGARSSVLSLLQTVVAESLISFFGGRKGNFWPENCFHGESRCNLNFHLES